MKEVKEMCVGVCCGCEIVSGLVESINLQA